MQFSKTELMVRGEKIVLDSSRLHFDESSLSEYLETEGGWYDYFAAKLAEAEYELQLLEVECEAMYSEKFTSYKSNAGGSDKFAEANAKMDNDYVELKKKVVEAKRNSRLLAQHLRAWDKCHDNAQSRGHFLRKEMDKLNRTIMTPDEHKEYDEFLNIVQPHDSFEVDDEK